MKKITLFLIGILSLVSVLIFATLSNEGDDKSRTANKIPNQIVSNLTENEILVSGVLSDSDDNLLKDSQVRVSTDGSEITSVITESDAYIFTHLTRDKKYKLTAEKFEVEISVTDKNEIEVNNIKGKFSLGRNFKNDAGTASLLPSTVYLSDNYDYEISDSGQVVTFPFERQFNVGDAVILVASREYFNGYAFEVAETEIVDGKTIVKTTETTFEELVSEINIDYTSAINDAHIILDKTTEVMEENNQNDVENVAWLPHKKLANNKETVNFPKLSQKFKTRFGEKEKDNFYGEAEIELSGQLSLTMRYTVWNIGDTYVKITPNFHVISTVSMGMQDEQDQDDNENEKSIPIGIVPIPVLGPIRINLRFLSTSFFSKTFSVGSLTLIFLVVNFNKRRLDFFIYRRFKRSIFPLIPRIKLLINQNKRLVIVKHKVVSDGWHLFRPCIVSCQNLKLR